MKKELLIHLFVLVGFSLLVILFRRWFDTRAFLFFLGGILGTLLPDLDHLIYVYYLRPQDLTSQRVSYLNQEKNYKKAIQILLETRYERTMTIFHSVFFQVVIIFLTIFVVTSSGSPFAMGIVSAFSLHLLVDQVIDIKTIGNIQTWFRKVNIIMDKKLSTYYVTFQFILLAVISFVM